MGCNHMTCSRCRHEFCWQCLQPHTHPATGGRCEGSPDVASFDPEKQNLIRQVVEKYDVSLEARRKCPLVETVVAFAIMKYATAASSTSTTQPASDFDEGASEMHQAVLRLEARHFQRQHPRSVTRSSAHDAFDFAEERQWRWMMMIEMEEEEAMQMQRQRAMEVDEEAVAMTRQVAAGLRERPLGIAQAFANVLSESRQAFANVIRQAFANVLSESRVPISLGTADELEQRIDRARGVYREYEALVTKTRQATALRNALQEMAPVDQDFDLRVQVIGVLANQVAFLTWNANSKLCELALLLGHLAPEERSVDVEWTFSSLKERWEHPEAASVAEKREGKATWQDSLKLEDWKNIFDHTSAAEEARLVLPWLLAQQRLEYASVLGRKAP
jgi:hypothetical protein